MKTCLQLVLLMRVFSAVVSVFASGNAGEDQTAPLVVQARLIEATPIPDLADIAPYDSALVVHTYRVLRVITGELPDEDISVAHWAIREKKKLDVPIVTNESVRLTLVPYQECPELRGEKVVDTTASFDLLYFYAGDWREWLPHHSFE